MKKAKPTGGPGTLPSDAELRQWFLLPLAPTKREANAGVPVVLPVGGKTALARIAWPNDRNRQRRFIKAGRQNPYGLTREEYIHLASTDSYRMTDGMIDDLLTAWAVRAAKNEPAFIKHRERSLEMMFTEQLIELLLGCAEELGQLSGEPHEIVRRYLLSNNWKHTVELLSLENKLNTPRQRGTRALVERTRQRRDKIRAAAGKIKHPSLTGSRSTLIGQVQLDPELVDKKSGRPPSAATIRRALSKSQT
jgi:hypothetical protein